MVILIFTILGIVKSVKENSSVVKEDVLVYSKEIPVGNNLMMKREVAPFTLILKQLGLVS